MATIEVPIHQKFLEKQSLPGYEDIIKQMIHQQKQNNFS